MGTKAKNKSTVQSTHPERICLEYHNLSPLNQQQDSHIVLDQKLDLHVCFKFDQELDPNQDLDLKDQNLDQHLEGLSQNAFNVIIHH
jgi:capsid portal protein